MPDAPLRRILVVVDLSPASAAAAAFTARLAAPHGATVELLYALSAAASHELDAWWSTLDERERSDKSLQSFVTAEQQGRLNELAAGMRLGGVREVEIRVVEGVNAKAVVDQAARYDLLVLGVRDASRVGILRGDMARRILRNSPVPVLVVPEPSTAEPSPPRT